MTRYLGKNKLQEERGGYKETTQIILEILVKDNLTFNYVLAVETGIIREIEINFRGKAQGIVLNLS